MHCLPDKYFYNSGVAGIYHRITVRQQIHVMLIHRFNLLFVNVASAAGRFIVIAILFVHSPL